MPLTRVVGQVGEADGLALHLVGEAAQRHADLHLLRDVLVLVRRRLEDDGDLPVHVRLRELAVCLPGVSPEDDLDVVCKKNDGESSENNFLVCLKRQCTAQRKYDYLTDTDQFKVQYVWKSLLNLICHCRDHQTVKSVLKKQLFRIALNV